MHQSGRAGPSAFDLSVKAMDLAPVRPPPFAGEDASEAATSGGRTSGGEVDQSGASLRAIHPR